MTISTPLLNPMIKNVVEAYRNPLPTQNFFETRPNKTRHNTLEKDAVNRFGTVTESEVGFPFHFFFLSATPVCSFSCSANHMKIFSFIGSLDFHSLSSRLLRTPLNMKNLSIDFVE